jgi:predicted site-specific integrase-resolvase
MSITGARSEVLFLRPEPTFSHVRLREISSTDRTSSPLAAPGRAGLRFASVRHCRRLCCPIIRRASLLCLLILGEVAAPLGLGWCFRYTKSYVLAAWLSLLPYSLKCLEVEFSEVCIQHLAYPRLVRPRELTKGAAVSSTNGHGPKRAILYARVSGEEQVKKGYSLADQLDALRDWCSTNDYEIIDEVQDRGFSGAYLERPGLDRIREMVAGGDVDAVVVLFRDRIARGVYAQLLSEEFRESGARLVALNSRGDDSPDGELGDNILDVIAAWERKKIFALGHLHPPFREQSDSALLR